MTSWSGTSPQDPSSCPARDKVPFAFPVSSVWLTSPPDDPAVVFLAEPDVELVIPTLPLELRRFEFNSAYYSQPQGSILAMFSQLFASFIFFAGRAKLGSLFEDAQRCTIVEHQNLQIIYAAKLSLPPHVSQPTITLLVEQPPPLSLTELLQQCENLPLVKIKVCFPSHFGGASSLHNAGYHGAIATSFRVSPQQQLDA